MKLTKNLISREQALAISADYVAYVEGDFKRWRRINEAFEKLKRGQLAISYVDGQFVRVRVSSIREGGYGSDGPVVRVSNGEYSWRVDGDRYAFPI